MTQRNFFPQLHELLADDQFLLFHERQVMVRGDGFLWRLSDLQGVLTTNVEIMLIDNYGSVPVLAINTKSDVSNLLDADKRSLRSLLASNDLRAITMAGKAMQVLEWYSSHRFCGICGSPTVHHASQRVLVCANCEQQFFPRINPCAIMLVVRGEELLLARNARYKSGFYSCLAGFIEIGETPEQTVAREVREEVGIEVENIRYARSQSWPFPSQLMLGFYADYKSGDIVPEPAEIESADWFRFDQLPPVPSANISVAGALIQDYVSQLLRERMEK